MAGLRPHSVEIEPGTVMRIWVPSLSKKKRKGGKKPAVILIYGFAADGIYTWQFQIRALTKEYDVYVPDILFFGGSTTSSSDRSPAFQANCLAKALQSHLGVESCTAVGFSYGGMVAFKMAEFYPSLVSALVISGSVIAMTDSIFRSILQSLGFSSSSDLLLPSDVKGLKAQFSVARHKKLWVPNRLHRDYLEVMFTNRQERSELLEGMDVSNKDAYVPSFPQTILLLWGENDQIFNIELAKSMKDLRFRESITQLLQGHFIWRKRSIARCSRVSSDCLYIVAGNWEGRQHCKA